MKRHLPCFAIVLFFIAAVAPAQTTVYDGLTLPTTITHPILEGFNNPTTLAVARSWWTANESGYTAQTCGFNTTQNCVMNAFGHLMTANQGTPIDCSTAITWAVTDVMQYIITNGSPAGLDGVDGAEAQNWYGQPSIQIYDWCYDQMTSAQRTTFVQGANIFFGPWQGGNVGGTIGFPCDNGIQGNLCWGPMQDGLEWGVVGYAEDTSNARQNLDWFFSKWSYFVNYAALTGTGGGYGGVPQEGVDYGTAMYTGPVIPLITAAALGRNLNAETNFFLSSIYAMIYGTTPSATYTNAGSPLGHTAYEIFPYDDKFSSTPGVGFLYSFGAYTGGPDDMQDSVIAAYPSTNLGEYGRTWLNTVQSQLPNSPWIVALDPGSSSLAYSGLPLDYYAPGSGFMWMRSAWDTTSTVAHLELMTASEVGHYHPWPGSWQMWRGGRWLSRETMGYAETFTGYNNTGTIDSQQSATMNGILVNPTNQGCTAGSTCQGDGGLYTLQNVASGGADNAPNTPYINPQLLRMESQPGYTYAAVDISGAYYHGGYGASFGYQSWGNNPAVQTVQREFVWVRDLETLVIFDRILTLPVNGVPAANMVRTFLAHCEYNWRLIDSNHANCVDGKQELALTTLLPATPNPPYVVTNEESAGDPYNNGQYRLEVNDTPGTAQSYFAHVLQGMAVSGTALKPTITDNGASYTIRLDSNHSITFVKGATSSGGSITLHGITTNLTTGVEPISVTTAGPVWGSDGRR
jgi:hypothetical protein